ncbi:MAG TPA: PadR family transcriptional regulator [Rhizomicrobium sp.]|nr:PadR family transcriptional regulator [Rhizomicrobium sp.]
MGRKPIFSSQTGRLLQVLLNDPSAWQHGYGLMKLTGLQSGTLYPILLRLCDQGFLEAKWRESETAGKPRRHVYRLTPNGLAFAREQIAPARRGTGALLGAKA